MSVTLGGSSNISWGDLGLFCIEWSIIRPVTLLSCVITEVHLGKSPSGGKSTSEDILGGVRMVNSSLF